MVDWLWCFDLCLGVLYFCVGSWCSVVDLVDVCRLLWLVTCGLGFAGYFVLVDVVGFIHLRIALVVLM